MTARVTVMLRPVPGEDWNEMDPSHQKPARGVSPPARDTGPGAAAPDRAASWQPSAGRPARERRAQDVSSAGRPAREPRAQDLSSADPLTKERRAQDLSSADRSAQGRSAQDRPAQERPARLKVGVIGTGRVGAVLGAALARAGHAVVAASAVSAASRNLASRMLPGAVLTEPGVAAAAADLVLLTVPDDVLAGLVAGLAQTGTPLRGRLLAHASGRYGTAVLEPATRQGALPLALHPVMTFTGRPDDVDRLAGVCFGVTAPAALRPAAEALVIEMGGEPVVIGEDDRGLYHAALASAANHLVTLVAEAAELLRLARVSDPARMLGPLLSAALDNALQLGMAGLTGPVARGDAGTVAGHIDAIAKVSPPAGVAAYVAMARLTADRAIGAGLLAPADAERLLDVLARTPQ